MKKEVRVEAAIGMRLAHDLTRIVPGVFKGRAFTKGHIIQATDIPELLKIGKEHIYVLDLSDGELHEDDAALRMAAVLGGEHMAHEEPHEGKVVLKSAIQGLLKVNVEGLFQINSVDEIAVVSRRTNTVLEVGDKICGLRAIPLTVAEEKVNLVEKIARETQVFTIKPFQRMKVGVITTGSEVLKGRIEDKFGPVVRAKLERFGSEVLKQKIVGDAVEDIRAAIVEFHAQGADMVICTGGMSVDPDDRTPGAIKAAATQVVSYGMPMLPGSMLMLAYRETMPIFGLPGCVIFDEFTSFDLLLPRVLAGETVTRAEIAELGHGGLL
ncbi:molybdopterin-binding protein [Tumebacillus permanentifrigoris]|uniref:Molybdopterin molybdenumtransferase n=1 Tax=Tumebacillus permanentifrigoris TaxID=378543 RepID=A0A316DAE3_9BACL|nr:molybdopterin-binding protein [Tumebacillus permanentifrigoris]PWK09632.1 molybdenum cofactor synthesis domain-containing protein [Tumebacillus permanentifrigoris]